MPTVMSNLDSVVGLISIRLPEQLLVRVKDKANKLQASITASATFGHLE